MPIMYTSVKYVDASGMTAAKNFNRDDRFVQESEIPPFMRAPIGPLLKQKLMLPPQDPDYVPDDAEIEVVVVLRDEVEDIAPVMSGAGTFEKGRPVNLLLDGKFSSYEQFEAANEEYLATLAKHQNMRLEKRRTILRGFATRQMRQESPQVLDALKQGLADFRMAIKKADIEAFAKNNQDIVAAAVLAPTLYCRPPRLSTQLRWAITMTPLIP